MMKISLTRFISRIDGMQLRDRVVIFLLLMLSLVIFGSHLLLDSDLGKQRELHIKVRQERMKITMLLQQIRQQMDMYGFDPDAVNHARLEAQSLKNSTIQADLARMEQQLISPTRIPAFLRGVLKGNERLRVISVKSFPVIRLEENQDAPRIPAGQSKPVLPAAAIAIATPARDLEPVVGGGVYKHAIEVTVEGSYPDLLDYLKSLEGLPEHVFWEKATLNAHDTPRTTLSLVLYSLSLDKKWISF